MNKNNQPINENKGTTKDNVINLEGNSALPKDVEKKYKWSATYFWLLVCNIAYVAFFYWFMKHY